MKIKLIFFWSMFLCINAFSGDCPDRANANTGMQEITQNYDQEDLKLSNTLNSIITALNDNLTKENNTLKANNDLQMLYINGLLELKEINFLANNQNDIIFKQR